MNKSEKIGRLSAALYLCLALAACNAGGRDSANPHSPAGGTEAQLSTPPEQEQYDTSGLPIVALPAVGTQVWRGGVVLTMDGQNTVAEALMIDGDQIVAVGSNAEAESWITPLTRVVELDGRTVMPGFIEGHGHFPGAGLAVVGADLNSPPIGRLTRVEEAIEELKAANQRRNSLTNLFNLEGQLGQGSEWLLGFGYDDTQIDDKRHLTRHDLDQVSSSEPIYVMHISGHIGYVNSLGLERLGITRDTPDPEGGHIGREDNGEPNGVLFETAKDEGQAQALNFSLRDQANLAAAAVKIYAAEGYTTVQQGLASAAFANAIATVSKLGLVPQRVVMWPDAQLGRELVRGEQNESDYTAERVRLGATKLIADGSIQGYTGFMRMHYHDPGEHQDDYRGYPIYPLAELMERVIEQHCAGRQVAIHGNGDAAIDDIIEAVTVAQQQCPRDDTRHIAVHSQMSQDDQLQSFADLGITPSFFAAHVYYWGDRHRDVFMGPQRAERISPMASAKAYGLRYSTHLDNPIVPIDSAMQLWSAVERQTAGGFFLGREQAATRLDALRALTIEAAWQNFMADEVGSIEAGKFADLVISDMNPLNPTADLARFKVQQTWVAGQRIY